MSDEIGHPVMPPRVKPVKFPSYMRPPIDLELEEPEVDLEFIALTVKVSDDERSSPDGKITQMLNEGWQLDDKIICRPFVTLIFSREKEEVEEHGRENDG